MVLVVQHPLVLSTRQSLLFNPPPPGSFRAGFLVLGRGRRFRGGGPPSRRGARLRHQVPRQPAVFYPAGVPDDDERSPPLRGLRCGLVHLLRQVRPVLVLVQIKGWLVAAVFVLFCFVCLRLRIVVGLFIYLFFGGTGLIEAGVLLVVRECVQH